MGPDVERLIGQLEEAQDAVCGWAAGVSVAGDDAVLMENLEKENSWLVLSQFDNFVKPILFRRSRAKIFWTKCHQMHKTSKFSVDQVLYV